MRLAGYKSSLQKLKMIKVLLSVFCSPRLWVSSWNLHQFCQTFPTFNHSRPLAVSLKPLNCSKHWKYCLWRKGKCGGLRSSSSDQLFPDIPSNHGLLLLICQGQEKVNTEDLFIIFIPSVFSIFSGQAHLKLISVCLFYKSQAERGSCVLKITLKTFTLPPQMFSIPWRNFLLSLISELERGFCNFWEAGLTFDTAHQNPLGPLLVHSYLFLVLYFSLKTSQELRMLSSVDLNCQETSHVMN